MDCSGPLRSCQLLVPKKNRPRLGALPLRLAPLNTAAALIDFSSDKIAATFRLIAPVIWSELPSGAWTMPIP